MTFPAGTDPAISIDEIGIATARHGGLVLRSAFQLVFRPEGEELHAAAAESFLRPYRKGLPLPPRPFLGALDADERLSVERLAAVIHATNHGHIGVEGLPHILGLGCALAAWPGAASLLADMAGRDAVAEPFPPPLVCSLRMAAGVEKAQLAALAGDLASSGIRLALGGPVGEPPPLDAIRRLEAPIVRIDGAWFRRVARNAGARRLMASLVAGFKGHGAQVLVEGIETRDQLAAALEMGADLLQGFLLSYPQLAGTAIERSVIALPDILPAPAPVIPLFGSGR